MNTIKINERYFNTTLIEEWMRISMRQLSFSWKTQKGVEVPLDFTVDQMVGRGFCYVGDFVVWYQKCDHEYPNKAMMHKFGFSGVRGAGQYVWHKEYLILQEAVFGGNRYSKVFVGDIPLNCIDSYNVWRQEQLNKGRAPSVLEILQEGVDIFYHRLDESKKAAPFSATRMLNALRASGYLFVGDVVKDIVVRGSETVFHINGIGSKNGYALLGGLNRLGLSINSIHYSQEVLNAYDKWRSSI